MNLTNLLVFAISLCVACAQECLPFLSGQSTPADQLDIGSVDIKYSGKPLRQNYYNVTPPTVKAATYTVIVGLGYIDQYFDLTSLDFQVRVVATGPTFTILFSISLTANWVFAHIYYLATSRDQIMVGDFSANSPQLLMADKSTAPKIIKLTYFYGQNKQYGGNGKSAIARSYISGIFTSERFAELGVMTTQLNVQESKIYVTVNSTFQRAPITTLVISYIIYNNINTGVYASLVNPNLTTTSLKSSIDNKNSNIFASITRASFKDISKRMLIQLASIEEFTRNFQIEAINFQATLMATPLATYPIISVNGSVNSNSPGSNCTSFTGCRNLGGTVINNPKNSSSPIVCVLCRVNSEYDISTNNCVCLPEYYNDDNGQCIKLSSACPAPQVYFNGSCYTFNEKILGNTCKVTEFFNPATKRCVCRPTSISYTSKVTGISNCVAPCVNGFDFDPSQEKCICRQRYLDENKFCSKCPPIVSVYNVNTNQCECAPGYALDPNNQCFPCSSDAQYKPATKRCDCKSGFIGNGFICRRQQPTLPPNTPIIFVRSSPA